MPKSRPPYPTAFRQQMVELVRSGRYPRRAGSGVRAVGRGDTKLGRAGCARRRQSAPTACVPKSSEEDSSAAP